MSYRDNLLDITLSDDELCALVAALDAWCEDTPSDAEAKRLLWRLAGRYDERQRSREA